MTYSFLQHYWWFLIALLGGLLVFLLFVQGANSLVFRMGRDESERELIINSTGRKWEFTFTTLVTFGGAFFASFPLFYSTSFGGAYWVWMLILVSFVLQAVSYEYQAKKGNVLGKQTFRWFLVFNGVFGPFLLGAAVATFFTGSAFTVDHAAMGETQLSPVVSQWASPWHGLEALANPWNWVLGFAVLFLARMNGTMYMLNNINDDALRPRLRRQILVDAVPFLLFFLAFVGYLLTADGFAVDEQGAVTLVSGKYLLNFLDMPLVLVVFLVGVVLVLSGITIPLRWKESRKGIWFTGTGTVLAVLALFLVAGYNGTSYYPSTADLQSSLTIENSCSSEFTLYTMAIVSLLIPFVLAYIFYCWRAIDKKELDKEELATEEHKY
ncbi:cytochrome d ubiquinol oxidase subunit II [Pseudoprevotella muciniphila]|uniref:Cytochrome d ubiquinol oxidase subunit II n=1 Tax=Pseudoprevotella muciniphila TaxID=2133944 RepID=A0A5P8E9U4_9BACT|nr:cytochrome d ubiquinol oxidase subunit II [Pseudoprevotella muciniphila]QFQ13742.1 cytochrome d ubiquinol oxidase subunit II [Pseudoprevotella muciniphila]